MKGPSLRVIKVPKTLVTFDGFFFWRLISGFGFWSSSNLSILFSVGLLQRPATPQVSSWRCSFHPWKTSLKMPPERKATRSWIRPCNRGSIGIHRSRCPITWLRWSSEQRQFCGEMVTTKLGISLDVKKITEDHLQIRWFHLMSDSGTIVICQIYGARAAVLKQSRLIYPAI